jgi:hypothetical protein
MSRGDVVRSRFVAYLLLLGMTANLFPELPARRGVS